MNFYQVLVIYLKFDLFSLKVTKCIMDIFNLLEYLLNINITIIIILQYSLSSSILSPFNAFKLELFVLNSLNFNVINIYKKLIYFLPYCITHIRNIIRCLAFIIKMIYIIEFFYSFFSLIYKTFVSIFYLIIIMINVLFEIK
jgi:hypothetical protein